MSSLRVSLFGKLQISWRRQTLIELEARKAQELFCYLLLHRERPHPRETIAHLLSNGASATQSQKCLRQALWQLQSTLNPQTTTPALLVHSDWIQLNPQLGLWLDVAVFEEAFALARGVLDQKLDSQAVEALQTAVQLYQGDLLEGWYQGWCLFERTRLQDIYLAMLSKLMAYCEAHQEYEAGLDYGRRVLEYDRAHERAHRRLMRLQYLCGNRTGALRQYERCVAALEEELGVRPANSTERLYQQICAGKLNDPIPDLRGRGVLAGPSATSLPALLANLHNVQADLASIQNQLEYDIQVIRQALDERR